MGLEYRWVELVHDIRFRLRICRLDCCPHDWFLSFLNTIPLHDHVPGVLWEEFELFQTRSWFKPCEWLVAGVLGLLFNNVAVVNGAQSCVTGLCGGFAGLIPKSKGLINPRSRH